MAEIRTVKLPPLCNLKRFVDFYSESKNWVREEGDLEPPEEIGTNRYLEYVTYLEKVFVLDIWPTFPPGEQKFELVAEEIEPGKEVDLEEQFNAHNLDQFWLLSEDSPAQMKSKIMRACEMEVGILKFIHKHDWRLYHMVDLPVELAPWERPIPPGWQKRLLEEMFGPIR